MENKFKYLEEYSLYGLINERDEVLSDIDYLMEAVDSNIDSNARSEFYEDLKNDREKLEALNYYIENKGRTRK